MSHQQARRQPSKNVIYQAPTHETISRFVIEVCSALGVEEDVIFNIEEMRSGLTELLEIAAEMGVKQANESSSKLLDSPSGGE